jgi:hypothetical protein
MSSNLRLEKNLLPGLAVNTKRDNLCVNFYLRTRVSIIKFDAWCSNLIAAWSPTIFFLWPRNSEFTMFIILSSLILKRSRGIEGPVLRFKIRMM